MSTATRLSVVHPGGENDFGSVSRQPIQSISTVKPVLTFRKTIYQSFLVLVIATGQAQAQTRTGSSRTTSAKSTSGQSGVRSSERVARATWQPTRDNTGQAAKPKAHALVDAPLEAASNKRTVQSNIRQVGHNSGAGIPVPPSDSVSIIDPPVYLDGDLDGQVMMPPMHDGAYYEGDSSCDAMGGSCGCGDVLCSGGCDSMGSCGGSCSSGNCGSAGCSTCGELIGGNAWRPCVTLCLPQDGWFSAEYLMWFQDGMDLPPLVTTSPTGTNVNQAGVLGAPGTRTLFGGNDVLTDSFDGFRINAGVWLDKCHTWGLGGDYFRIGQESESLSRTSSGAQILARPFFNINPTTGAAREDAELVAFPGVIAGTVTAEATSELFGAGIHVRYLRCCDEGCSSGFFCGCPGHYCTRQETMVGYRYLELQEGVRVNENLRGINPVGTFNITDTFETQNQFNGIDLGWKYRRTRGYWSVDTLLRMGIGVTNQTVRINGTTTSTSGTAAPVTSVGGLLAQRTNIGTYEQDEFSVVPEFNINLGYQLTDHLRATVGYTFLYWSNVVRPGDQISRDINPSLLPPESNPFTGAERPTFDFDTTDYWAQGISFGGEYRW